MIAEPPSKIGAVHVKATCALPAVPETPVGASGGECGVTAAETPGRPVPAILTALTRNV